MSKTKSINRREFLRQSSAGLAVGALALSGCATHSTQKPARKIPIGVQLYSVRVACKADFAGTLAKISKMGYAGVEFAGYFGHTAPELRRMLDDNGLVACGTHTPSEDVRPDKFDATIEFNQILGNHFVIVPDMQGKTRQVWLDKAARFNEMAGLLRPKGMSIGYHSHFHDFHPVEGEMPWHIFGENTEKDVILQLDTSNCRDGGADPMTELRKFPGRTRSIHIKPNGGPAGSIITEDKIDWPAVFEYCEHGAGVEWYVVEHESAADPLAAVARTHEKLRELGKV